MTLSRKILLGMVLGIAVGLLLHAVSGGDAPRPIAWLVEYVFDVVGRVFIASLNLLVVPLVLVSLISGTASMGANVRMGRIAVKTLALYLSTTAVAIALALGVASLIDPGVGIDTTTDASFTAPESPASIKEVLVNIFPTNPIRAMADGNMLQIIVFALLVGTAMSQAGAAGRRVLQGFQAVSDVIMRMVTILLHLAPYGVFCLLAKLFIEEGVAAIGGLALYFLAVTLALLLHLGGVYTSLFVLFTRLSPLKLLKNVRPAALFAFSTASSNATLPVTLRVIESRVGVDNSIAAFTVPLGATINMDGTAIMQGVATVFIAQAYGIDIPASGYLAVILTATLASIGTAGVPGVGLIMLTMVLNQAGLPVEGVGLIIGVDRLLDMMRTAVNVTGDAVVSTIVARSEGLLDERIFNDVSDRDEYDAHRAGS